MGVNMANYILVGVDIGAEHLTDELYENDEIYSKYISRYKHKVGEIVYLPDGMSGEYFIIGIPLVADTESYNGLGLNVIDEDYGKQHKDKVKKHIKDQFGLDVEPVLIVLTHHS